MTMEVRAASEADFDALVQPNQVVQRLHAALYPSDFKQEVDPCAVRAFFASRLAAPKNGIGIAEAYGVPIGYVWFEVQAQPETPFRPPRPRIYVHHISVAPEARRRGTATALLRYVEHRKVCAACGEAFIPSRSDAVFCSLPCQLRAYRRRKAAKAAARLAAIDLARRLIG